MSGQLNRKIALPLVALAIATIFVAAQSSRAADPAQIAKHAKWVTALAFSADNKTLVTVGGDTLLYRPGEIKL